MRALLLYNPAAGEAAVPLAALIARIKHVLSERGLTVETAATVSAGSAGKQAATACAAGVDLVFACGGDGTLHEVLQGMVGHPSAALGLIPIGTANALARHLGLSMNPMEAALQQLQFEPQLVPAGRVFYQTPLGESSRYFMVMAGAGPDGMLVYRMLAGGKQKLGRAMYYLRAATLFLISRFSPFTFSAETTADGPITRQVASAMAVRVGDLGGLFGPLVSGADLHDPHVRVTLARTPGRVSLPAWFVLSWARLHHWNAYVETLDIAGFSCSVGQHAPVQVQADGEWLGRTPMRVELIPDAVRLLMPSRHSS